MKLESVVRAPIKLENDKAKSARRTTAVHPKGRMPVARSGGASRPRPNGIVSGGTQHEVWSALDEISGRCLFKSHAWLAELYGALVELHPDEAAAPRSRATRSGGRGARETAMIVRARSLFPMHEYARAAEVVSGARTGCGVFLRIYAGMLDAQQRGRGRAGGEVEALRALRDEAVNAGGTDGYLLYVRGAIERRLGMNEEAKRSLEGALKLTPWNWGCWLEMARLVDGARGAREVVSMVNGAGVMGMIFVAHVCAETDELEEARRVYEKVSVTLPKWRYARAQQAGVLYAMRLFDESQEIYERIFEEEPTMLEGADLYSNILFVKEDRPSLAILANRCEKIDRSRLETCIVIGNYLSLRQEHEDAIRYFQRALKLNPRYLSAWTLLGHEYVEMKNASAAIEAYRKAVDINANDYRAWYALGQTYELMQMPSFTLYYFRRAAALRPRDARMWSAVAHTYEELNRPADAARCYERAVRVGAADGVALARLAAVHVSMAEAAVARGDARARQTHRAQAAKFYAATLKQRDQQGLAGPDSTAALKFLAHYCVDTGDMGAAERYCERLLPDHSVKDFAQNLLRQLHDTGKSPG